MDFHDFSCEIKLLTRYLLQQWKSIRRT